MIRGDVVEIGDVSLQVFCYNRARVPNEHLSDQRSVIFGEETLKADQLFPLRSSSSDSRSQSLVWYCELLLVLKTLKVPVNGNPINITFNIHIVEGD